jgi:hypothetical protein
VRAAESLRGERRHLLGGPVAQKRAMPSAISWRTPPSAKMSDRWSALCPRACSGAMYPTVQRTVPGSVCAIPDVDGKIGLGGSAPASTAAISGRRQLYWSALNAGASRP